MSEQEQIDLTAEEEEDLNKIDADEDEELQKNLQQYKQAYKNILWIDDRDDNDAGNNELTWMQDFCDLPTCMRIEQVDSFITAVNQIISNSTQYDLVIFDINLEKSFVELDNQNAERLKEKFGEYQIKFDYHDIDKKHAGYWLYRLLLAVGYPLKRMLIFSGHDDKETAQGELYGIQFNSNNFLKKPSKIDIERKFFDGEENEYYRIRRLVFQACEYWKKELKSAYDESQKIPFNQIYFSDNLEIQISPETFKETLERVEMLFPVVKPQNPERIYYQALQMVAMIHEESADIGKVKGYGRPYHSTIRNFRNWSAHNKFQEPNIEGDKFALLFCIALRTFFEKNQEDKQFHDLFPYEILFNFTNLPESEADISAEGLETKLSNIWIKLYSLQWNNVKALAEKKKKGVTDLIAHWHLSGKMFNLIYQILRDCKTEKLSKNYLFVTLWCASPEIGNFIKIEKESIDIEEPTKESVVVTYKWHCNREICQKICNTAKENSAEAVFMRYCYRWL